MKAASAQSQEHRDLAMAVFHLRDTIMEEAMVDLVPYLPLILLCVMGRDYNPDNFLFFFFHLQILTHDSAD